MEMVQGYVGLMSAIDMKFEALHDVLLAGRRENQDGFHKVNENISNIMNVQILLCRDVAMLKEESAALRAECNSSATRLTSRSCTAAVAKPTDCRQGVALPAGLLSASALPAGLQKAR